MKFAKKKKAKNEIIFQKIKGTFLDSIQWMKSLQPPLIKFHFEGATLPSGTKPEC